MATIRLMKSGGSVSDPFRVRSRFVESGKSGIHIKKSRRGSFTKWCGGKVTEECIRRGKNSSNPAIRRKAVFAQNSRRWKKG